jgi:hypothetical protein
LNRWALALAVALCACSADDGASGRAKLVGNYRLVVPAGEAAGRKDFAGSALRMTRDGMFTLQCRYRNGRTDSVIGTWTYSDRRARFSAFKDCAGVWPPSAVKREMGATLAVEFASPPAILLSPKLRVRYEQQRAQ